LVLFSAKEKRTGKLLTTKAQRHGKEFKVEVKVEKIAKRKPGKTRYRLPDTGFGLPIVRI